MSLSLVKQTSIPKVTVIKRALTLGRYNNTSLKCTSTLLRPYYSNNYSTATATAASTSNSNNKVDREHIILPNPGLSTFKTTARVLPSTVAEQFAILKACIMSGTMDRAERIMVELYKSKPEEMKIFADVNIYNTFLNGFIESPGRPMTKECLHWFDSMRTYGVHADANTYAIIVKGFLK
jgi:DNA-directed RNA polymerase